MTYYIANIDHDDAIMCDACADDRWETDPKYGCNVDARLAEAEVTGIRWSWTPRWSSDPTPCDTCGALTK